MPIVEQKSIRNPFHPHRMTGKREKGVKQYETYCDMADGLMPDLRKVPDAICAHCEDRGNHVDSRRKMASSKLFTEGHNDGPADSRALR